MFEQLGESRLEGAVTTDITGKEHAHALRLDKEATPEVKKARLHRKVATTMLLGSSPSGAGAEIVGPGHGVVSHSGRVRCNTMWRGLRPSWRGPWGRVCSIATRSWATLPRQKPHRGGRL